MQKIIREGPEKREATLLEDRLEAMAGIAGIPEGSELRDRLLLFEVLAHISTGRFYLEGGNGAAAWRHLDRALFEIDRQEIRARFPSSLIRNLEEMRRQARP